MEKYLQKEDAVFISSVFPQYSVKYITAEDISAKLTRRHPYFRLSFFSPPATLRTEAWGKTNEIAPF